MLLETIKMSFKTLRSNIMRTFLTILGVVIGIGSIIALTSITEGATEVMMSEMSSFGADTIYISITENSTKDYFNESDIEVFENLSGVTGVMPTASGYYTISSELGLEEFISTSGVSEMYFERNDIILEGRGLNYYDILYKTNAVVIGEDLSEMLFANMSPIGETIKISGMDFVVVGVAEENVGISLTTGSEICYVAYSHIQSTFLSGGLTSLEIYYDTDSYSSDEMEAAIEQELYYMLNSNEDAYWIFAMAAILDLVDTMMATMNYLLIGIAAISLLVGGIGIMNMMLTSVTERTNEIGLKKALGAEKSIILLQFIVEAIIISTIGGIIGVAVGYGLGGIAGMFMDFSPVVTSQAIMVAVGFSAAVGLGFGIMPAQKAANLKPIDALRAL